MPTQETGSFVWYDLFTPDQDASKKFYGDLFGWEYENFDISGAEYPMIRLDGTFLGGISNMEDPAAVGHPHWTAYVTVADVEATCARAEQLGGQVVVPPTDIPQVGRYAVIADPQGATTTPFTSLNPSEAGTDTQQDHTFCWSECLTSDSPAAAEFYSSLYGWKVQVFPMKMCDEAKPYHVFFAGEKMHGGAMDLPPEAAQVGAQPHWLYYIKVADVDEMAKKASGLGGSLTCPAMDIPDTGRFCVITDPQGAMFALFRPLQGK